MKIISWLNRPLVAILLVLAGLVGASLAQEVSIPDAGLNAAVRATLQITNAPLTQQDMLALTNLDASRRNVRSLAGLETASNLVSLDLQINLLTNLTVPTGLTKLKVLDLSSNPLTNVFLPATLTNLTSLTIEAAALTSLNLPAGLATLTNLDLENNSMASFDLPSNLSRLVALDLGFNLLGNFSLPAGLTNLSTFYFAGNPLTNVILPDDLIRMTELNLSQNLLTDFTLPSGMTNLEELDLAFNQLANVKLPDDLGHLTELELDFNRLASLDLPALPNLGSLHLRANLFTNFNLTTELPVLTYLDVSESPLTSFALSVPLNELTTLRLSENRLASLVLPAGLTNLVTLNLNSNLSTNLVLPSDLGRLDTLLLGGNQFTSITLPSGLTNLTGLFLTGDQLTNITLPPDMTKLVDFGFLGNPLTTFVLPEPLAETTNIADAIASLEGEGIPIYRYPIEPQLVRPRPLVGAFQFGLAGPPGVYSVLASTDLAAWTGLSAVTNRLGAIDFVDTQANLAPQRFYRSALQAAPTNMVFIPPGTFTMGSPSNYLDASSNERPQTIVTLTHGFWIAKTEVTQGEYLAVTGENPSDFPGDLSRAISSVTWSDATNYCAKLTERELAVGRILPGSHYRLPTESEWECAARAGTATRFSYGDDPFYLRTTNYAWFIDLGHPDLIVHPVGQKLPNPWGLYDMAGNVWEWCQDWYGEPVGGVQTDPTGPASNAQGLKVMRGGAYDYPNSSCRSASRLFRFFNMPDSDVGFRVVLVVEP